MVRLRRSFVDMEGGMLGVCFLLFAVVAEYGLQAE